MFKALVVPLPIAYYWIVISPVEEMIGTNISIRIIVYFIHTTQKQKLLHIIMENIFIIKIKKTPSMRVYY